MAKRRVEVILELTDGFSKPLKAVEKGAAKSTKNLSLMWTEVNSAIGVARQAVDALKGAYEFAQQGAAMGRLRDAGSRLASSMGTDMGQILEAMRTASKGTISEMDLMAAANRALRLGVAETPEDFADMTKAAIALGRAMGRDAKESIDDIVTGIGRMSPLILDNIGVMTNGGQVFEDYAESIGIAASELTDAQKKQALLNQTVMDADPLLDSQGNLIDDQAESYEQLNAALADAKLILQELVSGPLVEIIGPLTEDIRLGLEFKDALEQMDGAVRRLPFGLVHMRGEGIMTREAFVELANSAERVQLELDKSNAKHYEEVMAQVRTEASLTEQALLSLEELLEQIRGGIANVAVARSRFLQEGGGAGFIPTEPELIAQQHGGRLAPFALVGEAGPELILGGHVIPAGPTRKLLSHGLKPKQRMQAGGSFAFDAQTIAQILGQEIALTQFQAAQLTQQTIAQAQAPAPVAAAPAPTTTTQTVTQAIAESVASTQEAAQEETIAAIKLSGESQANILKNQLQEVKDTSREGNRLLNEIWNAILAQADEDGMRNIMHEARDTSGF